MDVMDYVLIVGVGLVPISGTVICLLALIRGQLAEIITLLKDQKRSNDD